MHQLRTILVGVDFSACSAAALKQAVRIAGWNDATLRILHVIPQLVVVDLAEALGRGVAGVEREAIENARAQLMEFAGTGAGSTRVELEVVVGAAIDKILEAVEREQTDLLVLGVTGESGPSIGAGTFATKCVRKAKTRVLLVHEEHTSAFRRVVACVDFSETSERALSQAVRIARHDKSELHVLHVYYGPWHKLHYRSPTPEASPAFQRQYLNRLEGLLDSFVAPFSAELEGIDSRPELYEHQSYGRGVVEYLRDNDADLVVLGTEGNTNLRYLLLGSTADRVLRDTPCSVLTIKPLKYSQDGG